MATCGECGAKAELLGDLTHRHGCKWQSKIERIKELEEALRLARYEINRVLDKP